MMRQYTYYIWDDREGLEICSEQIEDALRAKGLQFELADVETL